MKNEIRSPAGKKTKIGGFSLVPDYQNKSLPPNHRLHLESMICLSFI
jgi:hypothetical protein